MSVLNMSESTSCHVCDISWNELTEKDKSLAQQIHDHLMLANLKYCVYCLNTVDSIIKTTSDKSTCEQMQYHIELHKKYNEENKKYDGENKLVTFNMSGGLPKAHKRSAQVIIKC